jgi:hypothetical protein
MRTLLSRSRRAAIGAAVLAALAVGCDERRSRPTDGDEHESGGRPGKRAPSAADERSTVSCHKTKDESVCTIQGALTPFVLGELKKGHPLLTSTLVMSASTATTENLAHLGELADDLTLLRIEPPEGRRVDLKALGALPKLNDLDLVYSWSKKLATREDVAPVAQIVGLKKLSIAGAVLDDLRFLAPVASLEELSLGNCSILSLDGIAPHPALRKLSMNSVYEQADASLASLEALSALEEVNLRLEGRGCDLAWVPALANLTYFSVSAFRCAKATDVGMFARVPRLDRLRLQGLKVASLAPLGTAPALRDLFVESLGMITDLPDIARAPKLERLYVSEGSLADVSMFSSFTQLKRLEIYSQQPLQSMDALGNLTKLEELGLYVFATTGAVDDLPFLEKLPALKTVAFHGDFVNSAAVAELHERYPALAFANELPK